MLKLETIPTLPGRTFAIAAFRASRPQHSATSTRSCASSPCLGSVGQVVDYELHALEKPIAGIFLGFPPS